MLKFRSAKMKGEPEITFDIRFFMVTKELERIKIILNVEAQKKYYPGYHFEPRAVFYCARMLSEQLDREFTTENYDDLKKVYSIWIFFEAPKRDSDTITEYRLTKKDVYGKPVEGGKYDYLSISFIRMSADGKSESKDRLINMLDTLFSDELDVKTKKIILENEHQMEMTRKLEGGLDSMCNVGSGLWDRAMEAGMEKGLQQGRLLQLQESVEKILKKGYSVSEIADILEEPEEVIQSIANTLLLAGQSL